MQWLSQNKDTIRNHEENSTRRSCNCSSELQAIRRAGEEWKGPWWYGHLLWSSRRRWHILVGLEWWHSGTSWRKFPYFWFEFPYSNGVISLFVLSCRNSLTPICCLSLHLLYHRFNVKYNNNRHTTMDDSTNWEFTAPKSILPFLLPCVLFPKLTLLRLIQKLERSLIRRFLPWRTGIAIWELNKSFSRCERRCAVTPTDDFASLPKALHFNQALRNPTKAESNQPNTVFNESRTIYQRTNFERKCNLIYYNSQGYFKMNFQSFITLRAFIWHRSKSRKSKSTKQPELVSNPLTYLSTKV